MCAWQKVVAIALGLGMVTGLAPGRAAAAFVFSQQSNFGSVPQGQQGVWASQNDTAPGGLGNFATTYDSFFLPTTDTITGVTWEGGYFNPATAQTPIPGNISKFTLTFYNDNAGAPGSIFATESIANPSTSNNNVFNETPVGGINGVTNLENTTGGLVTVFDYSVSFPITKLNAGTTYWLSIVPDLNFSDNSIGLQWGWHTAFDANHTPPHPAGSYLDSGINDFTGQPRL